MVGDVELLYGYLASLLYLGLVLAVLRVLYLVGCSCAAALELHFDAEVPVAVELIVACQHEAWHGDSVAVHAGVALAAAVEAVGGVVLEGSHHLAVAADAEAVVAVYLCGIGVPLCRSRAGCKQHHGCKKSSVHSLFLFLGCPRIFLGCPRLS